MDGIKNCAACIAKHWDIQCEKPFNNNLFCCISNSQCGLECEGTVSPPEKLTIKNPV